MTTLGSCLVSHNIPFEGMAKDIIERRIEGQSWKQIGEELNIGSPGAARKMFTKLTGIDDYKIKGDALLKLAQGGGSPEVPDLTKIVAKKVAAHPDPSLPAAPAAPVEPLTLGQKRILMNQLKNHSASGALDIFDLTPYQTSLIQQLKAGKKLTSGQLSVLKEKDFLDMFGKANVPFPEALKPFAQIAQEAVPTSPPPGVMLKWQQDAKKQLLALDPDHPDVVDIILGDTDWTNINDINNFFTTFSKLKKPDDLEAWVKAASKGVKPPPVAQPAAKAATKAEIPDVTQSAKEYDWLVKDSELPSATTTEASKDAILELHVKGHGYQAISTKTGVPVPDVDRVVARALLEDSNGDVYKALLKKPDSVELQKLLSDKVYGAIQKGISPVDLKAATGVPKNLIDQIVQKDGKWSKPFGQKLPDDLSPTHTTGASKKPPSSIGDIGNPGEGETDPSIFPKATNDQLLAMRKRQWSTVGNAEDRRLPEHHTRAYTGSAYHGMNTSLRRGSASTGPTSAIGQMDRAMYSVDQAFSVTRGMGIDGLGMGSAVSEETMKNLVGKTFVERGYMSTSTKPVFGNRVRLNIEVPVGAKGHWAKPISIHSSEDEFILARDTKFMVLGVERVGGMWKLRVRVVV